MNGKTENYQADIHNDKYEAEYLTPRLDAAGLVNIDGRESESLNGKWNFGVDLYDTCRRAKWFEEKTADSGGRPIPLDWDWEAWDTMKVPATWNTEREELHYFEGSGVYTRTFRYVPKEKGERVFLRFEGAAYRTSVFLNRVFIGTHDGASTPFNIEITDTVKTENRIVVTVDAKRSPQRVPMENTDWFNYGGIYRDVLLVRTPANFVKDWFLRLVPDGTFSKIKADITVSAASGNANGTAVVEIPELSLRQEITLHDGKGSTMFAVRPELWSPENPKLYDVAVHYENDIARDRIGFREIKTCGHDIFLNGKKIFLKGISVHEDHFALGKTTTEETIRATIKDLKEMNGIYLRLAHYPHDARFSRIADEEGVMLWEEIPVYWAIAFGNPGTYADAENQLGELILRDRNRASVIIWSVGNENSDTDERLSFMSNLVKHAKKLDDSRLVSAACLINHAKLIIEDRLAEVLDIFGINEYYGWYDPDFSKLPKLLANSNPGKPVVICEFGGDARKGNRGTADDLFSEDCQKEIYEKQVETFKTCAYIAGTSPWILYDFRCPRRLNRYQERFNRKGLIDADRKTKKPAFFVMRDFYAEL